jgi:hypothetical protein
MNAANPERDRPTIGHSPLRDRCAFNAFGAATVLHFTLS